MHLAAFRAIAAPFGSDKLAICHDSWDPIYDAFLADASQDDCIALLTSGLGPPQPSVDDVAPEVVQQTEHGVPGVWYLDVRTVAEQG